MSSQPDSEKRDYTISDSDMLQDSKTCIILFTADLADFTAQDSMFTSTYATNWQTAIDDASGVMTDETFMDIQEQLSKKVEEEMANCRQLFQSSKYNIEKAFPDNAGVQHEFGYDNYDKVRKDHSLMDTFMFTFFTVAGKYSSELVAKGYTVAKIASIETQRKALETAVNKWKTHEAGRGTLKQTRIGKLNAVWKCRTEVAKAAKYVYADNYAKYQQYLLPASEEGAGTFVVSGTVTDSTTHQPIEGAVVNFGGTAGSFTTDSKGKYGAAKIAEGSYTLSISKAGYTTQTKSITLGSTALQVDVELVKI
jgi:hypothetical protein